MPQQFVAAVVSMAKPATVAAVVSMAKASRSLGADNLCEGVVFCIATATQTNHQISMCDHFCSENCFNLIIEIKSLMFSFNC